jgi:TatD DNase family protein
MLVDSHCHLDLDGLREQVPAVLERMQAARISHALCISVTLEDFPRVRALAETHTNLFASVGVHPDYPEAGVISTEQLVELTQHPKVVGIGETGLDYSRLTGDLEWQRDRFRTHIRAARETGKPLIVHTRAAAEDTLRVLREEHAEEVGGVLHCFTESQQVADAALAMNFYISFSGIVTFKNAAALKEIARRVPLDRMLVETDSPYLAPVPFRGKTNEPSYVRKVAEEIARLREEPIELIEAATTRNFFRLFKHAHAEAAV